MEPDAAPRTRHGARWLRPTKPRGRQQRGRDHDIRSETDPRTRPAQDTEHQRKAQDDVSRLMPPLDAKARGHGQHSEGHSSEKPSNANKANANRADIDAV